MRSTTCTSHVQGFGAGGHLHWEEWAPKNAAAITHRPVVLIHGLSDSCRTWSKLAPMLARTRRVYAVDLPGHGKSGRPDASYEVAWYSEIIGRWITSLKLGDHDLLGHSLGGGIAMRVLLDRPAHVQRVALFAPGGLGREVALPLRLAAVTGVLNLVQPLLLDAGTRAGMLVLGGAFDAADRKHLAKENARPGTGRALARTLRGAIDIGGQRENVLDHAHRIKALPPITIYWGDDDPVIPAKHAEIASQIFEGVQVRSFKNVGHYPHREVAGEVMPSLLRFLDEPQPTPRIRRKSPGIASAPRRFWQLVGAR